MELAIVAPALLLLIFFTIQGGLYYYGRVVAQQAAREGVSQLRLAQSEQIAEALLPDLEEGVRGYARTVGRETLLDPEAVAVYDAEAGTVQVTVRGRVISLVPGLDLTVAQQVTGQIERFEADEEAR